MMPQGLGSTYASGCWREFDNLCVSISLRRHLLLFFSDEATGFGINNPQGDVWGSACWRELHYFWVSISLRRHLFLVLFFLMIQKGYGGKYAKWVLESWMIGEI